ncbi:TPA: flagellar transcriptional regulator FlhC, partial [Shigella flexneri]|nr:flagellar transcriptional regulator FlhC [Shigella flexneri]
MSEKSIVQEARDIQLAMELITLGARLQMLESETQLSRGRLIKLYKELRGSPPPKGMLPFSTDWFMTWEQNVHASMFCNAWQFLLKTGLCNGVDAVIKAYRLYLEQCPQAEEGPLLALTRAWTLVRFVESG